MQPPANPHEKGVANGFCPEQGRIHPGSFLALAWHNTGHRGFLGSQTVDKKKIFLLLAVSFAFLSKSINLNGEGKILKSLEGKPGLDFLKKQQIRSAS